MKRNSSSCSKLASKQIKDATLRNLVCVTLYFTYMFNSSTLSSKKKY